MQQVHRIFQVACVLPKKRWSLKSQTLTLWHRGRRSPWKTFLLNFCLPVRRQDIFVLNSFSSFLPRIPLTLRSEKKKKKNEICQHFRKFVAIFVIFLTVSTKSRDILSSSEHLREIPTKIHSNWVEKLQILLIFAGMEWNFISFEQNFGRVFCCNFEIWAVQRHINLVDLKKCCKMRLFSLS